MKITDYIKDMSDYIPKFKSDLESIIEFINKKLLPDYKSVSTSIDDEITIYQCNDSEEFLRIGDIEISNYGEIGIFEDNSGFVKFSIRVGYSDDELPFPLGEVKRAAEFLRNSNTVKLRIGGKITEL